MHLLLVILEFAIVLGFMVFVHELGHFIVAKACGVRVETFSLGFPPRLFGFKHGDTDYCISAIPFGGYVKMAGEYGTDPADAAPGDLTSKPRWQRILIALAGPFSNFILAFFLLSIVAHYHHEVDKYLNGPAVVDYVPADTPAARDGMAAGDTILRFNNVVAPTWEQVLEESALNLNRSLPITFSHNGQTLSRDLFIATDDAGDLTPDSLAAIGLIPREQDGPVGISSISANTPADRVGLRPGDQITRVDALESHSVRTIRAYLKDRNGAPAVVSILRNGRPLTLALTPELVPIDAHTSQYQIGFMPQPTPVDIVRLPVRAALHESLHENRSNSTLVLRIVQGLFTRHVSVKQMSGPVGIAQEIDLVARIDFPWPLLILMSTISLQLGIFNLLPTPPLDGGMIFFLVVESLIRRDVNQRFKDAIYQVAFVCVIAFMCFIIFNDFSKIHHGH
jgi:regulator of sigma E protease